MSALVTVFMTCYNGSPFVAEAITSVLNQTFTDFEFIIIDDGSTDDSWAIIQSFSDPRIKARQNEKNLGLVKSRNIGLELAAGDYLAILDADDISVPERLEKQVAFMLANPAVDICGSDIIKFGTAPFKPHQRLPASHNDIWAGLIFINYLAHSSIMLRMDKFRQHQIRYNSLYPYAEDYGLWVEASQYCMMANINEKLVYYRVHQTNVSKKFEKALIAAAGRLRRKMLGFAGINVSDGELALHNRLAGEHWSVIFYPRKKILSWLEKIQNQCDSRYQQAVAEQSSIYLSKYNALRLESAKFKYWKNKVIKKVRSFL